MSRNLAAALAVVVFVATVAGSVAIVALASNGLDAVALCGVLVTASGTLITALVAAAKAEQAKQVGERNHRTIVEGHAENADKLDAAERKLDTIATRVNGELDQRIEAAVIKATQPLLIALAGVPSDDQRAAARHAAPPAPSD